MINPDSAPHFVTVRGIFSHGPGWGLGRPLHLRRASLSPGAGCQTMGSAVRMASAPLSDGIRLKYTRIILRIYQLVKGHVMLVPFIKRFNICLPTDLDDQFLNLVFSPQSASRDRRSSLYRFSSKGRRVAATPPPFQIRSQQRCEQAQQIPKRSVQQ